MPTRDKAALFRERAAHLRALAAKDPHSRLRDDLLRAAQEWEEMAQRVERER